MHPAPLTQIPRDRLAQLDHTCGRGVVRLSSLKRGDTRRDDRRRRIEIRLTDLKVNDVAAFRLERPRFGEDLECRLRPEARHA